MVVQVPQKSSEEQHIARYESCRSESGIGTVAVQFRIAAERYRKQKEMETTIAQLEAEVTTAVAGGNTNSMPAGVAGSDEGRSQS